MQLSESNEMGGDAGGAERKKGGGESEKQKELGDNGRRRREGGVMNYPSDRLSDAEKKYTDGKTNESKYHVEG